MSVAWQDSIRSALLARDVRERAFEPMIRDYSRLAHHARQLHERNLALVDAATGAKSQAMVVTGSQGGAAGGAAKDDSVNAAVRLALQNRLESELAQTRSELSDAYKLQSQHSQRLLALSDQLHASDERARKDREVAGELKMEVERLREGAKWHKEVVAEKEKQLVILQDELHSLELELTHLELQNDNLKTDNAALLQRWIHAKTEEARKMNEANAFLEEAKRIRAEKAAVGVRAGAAAADGEGEQKKEEEKEVEKVDVKGKGKAMS
ncbi:hypothetical protein JCM10908_006325 [Rhodotorula pacifica]|uniref:Atg16p n=1 Tax=Rhodotorula pacifica TaxID=1495444 RepID=UPI00317BAA9A